MQPQASQEQPKERPKAADLVDSINDSAKHVATLTLTFLAVCIYVGVAIASTTHEILLVGRDFTLPLFNAQVSLELFYVIAPLFVMVLHVHLMLQDYILVTKLVDAPWASDGQATYYYPEVTVSRMLGWKYDGPVPFLLKTIRWTVYVVLPVGILLWMQGQFLAYHSLGTTRWHQVLVTVDFLLILMFRWRISAERRQMSIQKRKHVWLYPVSWVILGLAMVAVLLFSWGVASIPDPNAPDRFADRLVKVLGWPARNLELRESVLRASEAAPELIEIYAKEKDLSIDDVRRQHIRGVSLNGRNLTGADFTGARLVNADFRGADLRNANFSGADLRGAKFMPAGAAEGRFDRPPGREKHLLIANARGNRELSPTRLEKANFTDANLEGASLILVNAAGAMLGRADLRGVELTYADLRGARLQRANLAGADLWHAILQRADLTNADLRAADLAFAELEGAVLTHAHVQAADLSNAQLAGAWFDGADLRAVQFRDAESTGASFRGAMLWSSLGLIPRGIILRQAKLDALCPDPRLPPQLVDLREVEPPDPKAENHVWSASLLGGVPEGPRRKAALDRLRTQPIQPYCKAGVPLILPANLKHLGLLYHDERRSDPLKPDLLQDWPPVAEQAIQAGSGWTEDDFYAELATLWVEDACRSESTARAMIRLATRPPTLAEEKLVTALKDRLKQRLEQAQQERAARAGQPGVGLPCPALLGLGDEDLK